MSKRKSTTKNLSLFERVYKTVQKIPLSKVTTYGEIARLAQEQSLSLGKKITPRIVGFALHANRDEKTPCHRVVNKDGRLAPGFAFDGPREQRRRLEAENVPFKDDNHVDLEKCLWVLK